MLILIVDNVELSKRIDFVLKLGIVPLICNYLLKSDNDNLLYECVWVIGLLCGGTTTQVIIISFNKK